MDNQEKCLDDNDGKLMTKKTLSFFLNGFQKKDDTRAKTTINKYEVPKLKNP